MDPIRDFKEGAFTIGGGNKEEPFLFIWEFGFQYLLVALQAVLFIRHNSTVGVFKALPLRSGTPRNLQPDCPGFIVVHGFEDG